MGICSFSRWTRAYTIRQGDDADLRKTKETVIVNTLRGVSVIIEAMSTCAKIFIAIIIALLGLKESWVFPCIMDGRHKHKADIDVTKYINAAVTMYPKFGLELGLETLQGNLSLTQSDMPRCDTAHYYTAYHALFGLTAAALIYVLLLVSRHFICVIRYAYGGLHVIFDCRVKRGDLRLIGCF
jgi:hypothetical protein